MKTGDRVYYISGHHGKGPGNPLKGSKYECQGTITTESKEDGLYIGVQWDNGTHNSYSFGDLCQANGGAMSPNLAFRLKKLKRR